MPARVGVQGNGLNPHARVVELPSALEERGRMEKPVQKKKTRRENAVEEVVRRADAA